MYAPEQTPADVRPNVVVFMTVASCVVAVMVLGLRGCGHGARFQAGAAGKGAGGIRPNSSVNSSRNKSPNKSTSAPASASDTRSQHGNAKRGARRAIAQPGRHGPSNTVPDRRPPEISVNLQNSRRNHLGQYGPRLRIVLTGRDPGGPPPKLYWRRKGAGWRRYRASISPYGSARRKKGTLEFMARDRAGNRSRVTEFHFAIDDVPPKMPFIYTGRPDSKGRDLIPRKGILIPTIEPRARMECRINAGPFRPCPPGSRVKPPGEGQLRLTFRVSDEVGNARTRTHVIRSDRTPPRTTIQTN